MFDTPDVVETPAKAIYHFIGVDAAYKGKDNICVSLISAGEDHKLHCEEIEVLDKSNWIDGVTNKQIIHEISRVAKAVAAPLVCVDQGWGVWLIDGLRDSGVNALGIAFGGKPTPERVRAHNYAATNAQNKRSEMHLDLQTLIEDHKFDITKDAYSKVKDIFPFVLAERKANNLVQICAKDKIKQSIGRSPDELDALLLGIHAAMLFFCGDTDFIV